jgi:hypothetical protein
VFLKNSSLTRRLASLSWLRWGAVRQVPQYYQGAMISCRSSRRASLPSLGGTSARTRYFRSLADECAVRAWSWSPGSSSRDLLRKRQDLPSSWGTSMIRLHMFSRRRQDFCTRPLQCSGMAPVHRTAKAPAKGLSTLNSMAFGLAVYASQYGLPTSHARLASGR